MSYKFIERKSQDILDALSEAPIYKKFGTVKARVGFVGEEIVTELADGSIETVNTVTEENQMVVTNPDGEKYIISAEKFNSRYEQTDEDGVYFAKGYCRAIKNPHSEPIEIIASWGSPQTGNENCLIADVCDKEGNLVGEPYLIDGDAFENTYRLV